MGNLKSKALSLPPVVVVVTALLAAINVGGALCFIPDRGGDFAMLYRSTASWVHGLDPYASAGSPTTNLNHPLVWLVFLPFLSLPEPVAFVFWTVLWLVVFAVAATKVAPLAGIAPLEVAFITLSLTGTSFELALGQISFGLMLLLCGAWWLDRHGHPQKAGLCVGLLCALKPFYGLIALMFVWRREWRAVAGCAASGVAAMVCGWVLAGTRGYLAWFDNLRHVTWTWHVFNGSVWGAASRVFSEQQVALATQWTPLLTNPLVAAIVAWAGVAGVVVLLRVSLRHADIDQTYALLSLASLLLSPLGWIYYLPAAFGPIVVSLSRRPSRWLWFVGALAICPYWLIVNRRYGLVATLTAGQISFVVVAGLFMLVVAATLGQERDSGRV